MPKRATLTAVPIILFLLFFASASASPAFAQTAASQVFPEGDRLRLVHESIGLGLEGFSQRLKAAMPAGREPLGLVLAGGSARAYAHIGVLETLEAHGIHPDFIVANSMGAVIGMLYAAGLSPAAIGDLVREIPPESYLRLVLPTKGGLINGDAFVGAVQRIVGNLDLSETKIPIIVTAEDLNTRRQVEMAQGDFSRVMATTFAMPAIFEPVPLGEYLLIDGGVTNIIPMEIAARYSSRLIVSTALYDKTMSFDNPLSVINRAVDIGKTRTGMQGLFKADALVIRNDVETISYMEFATPSRIIEAGRSSAEKSMASILEALGPDYVSEGPRGPIAEARAGYDASIGRNIALLSAGAFPAVVPSLRYRFDLKLANDFEREALGLEGQGYAGLSIAGSTGKLRSSLGFRAGLGDESGRDWGLFSSLAVNPLDAFVLAGEIRLWGDFGPWSAYAVDFDSMEILGLATWKATSPAFTLNPLVAGSWELNFDTGSISWELRPSLDALVNLGGASYAGSVGKAGHFPAFVQAKAGAFFSQGDKGFSLGPEWTLKAGIARRGVAALRGRWSSRIDLAGSGTALEPEDAFRGPTPAAQGTSVGVANFDLVWLASRLDFDAGEIVLVKDIEAGFYYDLAWSEDRAAGTVEDVFCAGLILNLTASFAGLTPLDMAFFAGMGTGFSPVVGFRASRLFPRFR